MRLPLLDDDGAPCLGGVARVGGGFFGAAVDFDCFAEFFLDADGAMTAGPKSQFWAHFDLVVHYSVQGEKRW